MIIITLNFFIFVIFTRPFRIIFLDVLIERTGKFFQLLAAIRHVFPVLLLLYQAVKEDVGAATVGVSFVGRGTS